MTSARPDGAAGPLPRTARRYDSASGHDAPARADDAARDVPVGRRPAGATRVRDQVGRTVRGVGAPCPHRLARTAAGRPPLRSQP
ncbi:hypothetical protein ACIBBB_35175 [Streptomyces sp. NPDC051217]|uniref:hypothetical protein n=1 Tax=Streptomyces sp. NPDC051217 TaxID=3365644 RepID=UPI00378DBBAC